ncbi:hypothetical protein LPJ72_004940 [Coemansia sp. Benny D160-2]|nr:hypothetical protein LPJ72_004940 [Coemansia sp. Benny D160-2]
MATPDQHIQNQFFHPQVMAQYTHDAFAAPNALGNTTHSTRVVNESESGIFYHDTRTNTLAEHAARQMVTSDGAVFIEHIAGYSVVFVPNAIPIAGAIGDLAAALQPAASQHHRAHRAGSAEAAKRRVHVTKPSNAFIMYRNFKIREMRVQNPAINQTDISREAGKWWKEESEDVKEMFRAKYREEKQAYDVLKSKRVRGNTDARQRNGSEDNDNGAYDDDGAAYGQQGGAAKRRKLSAAGLGLAGSRAGPKPRSRTMPTNAFGASSVARLSVDTADLRKHLAAKTHQHHQAHSFHNAYATAAAAALSVSGAAGIATAATSSPLVAPADAPISLDAVNVFQSVSLPQSDYSDHAAYMYDGVHSGLDNSSGSLQDDDVAAAMVAAAAAAAAAASASASAVTAGGNSSSSVPAETDYTHHSQSWSALADFVDTSSSAEIDSAGVDTIAQHSLTNTAVELSAAGFSPSSKAIVYDHSAVNANIYGYTNEDAAAYVLPNVVHLSSSSGALGSGLSSSSSSVAAVEEESAAPSASVVSTSSAAATVV